MYINIIMTILTNRQKITYIYTQLICYMKVHINIYVYYFPHRIWTLNYMYVFFFYELFLGYLHGHHKNIPFKFSMSFFIYIIKTGRQTYIVHQTSTSARYFCIVKPYTIIQQTRWICYAMQNFFFPKAKTCLTGFNLQRHLNE